MFFVGVNGRGLNHNLRARLDILHWSLLWVRSAEHARKTVNRNSRILIECPCPSGWASDILSYNPNRNSRIFIESNILSYNPNRLSRTLIESDILSYNPNRLSRILIKSDIVSYESQFTEGEQVIADTYWIWYLIIWIPIELADTYWVRYSII